MSSNPKHQRFPFKVPERYFGQAADDMTIAFLADPRADAPRRRWLAVASVLAFVAGGTLLYQLSSTESNDCVTFACLLEQTETRELEEELNDLLLDDSWGGYSGDWVDISTDDITF